MLNFPLAAMESVKGETRLFPAPGGNQLLREDGRRMGGGWEEEEKGVVFPPPVSPHFSLHRSYWTGCDK